MGYLPRSKAGSTVAREPTAGTGGTSISEFLFPARVSPLSPPGTAWCIPAENEETLLWSRALISGMFSFNQRIPYWTCAPPEHIKPSSPSRRRSSRLRAGILLSDGLPGEKLSGGDGSAPGGRGNGLGSRPSWAVGGWRRQVRVPASISEHILPSPRSRLARRSNL